MAISSVFLTQVGSTACSPLDWKWLPSSVATRCQYHVLCAGVNAPRDCSEPPPHSKHLVLLQFGCNGHSRSFLFYYPRYFCWCLIKRVNTWKDLQEIWSFPMQWDKISSTVAVPTKYFLKMPCAHIASACPLFHSPCIWRAFINVWSKLILLPIISGPSKTQSCYYSFSSSKLPFICLKPLNSCVSEISSPA